MPKFTSNDIYQKVTDRVIAALDKGVAPWQRPWRGEQNAPRNLQSGNVYRGINALMLSEFVSGYSDPRWTTFIAMNGMGGRLKQTGKLKPNGKPEYESGTMVTLWKRLKVKDADAPEGFRIIPMLRYFVVWNVQQIDWPKGALKPLDTAESVEFDADGAAEEALLDYVNGDSELSLRWGGNAAFYNPSLHAITLPDRECFKSIEGFYGTAFHECGHSTHRALKRQLGGGFGSDSYAREELIAEMTAAFVCATLGIDGGFDNSVAYLASWRSRIAADPKLIVQAAGKAQKAADLILGRMIGEDADLAVETEKEKIPA